MPENLRIEHDEKLIIKRLHVYFKNCQQTVKTDVKNKNLKGIFYIIFGSIAIGLVFALFGLAIAAIGVFPIKDFIFSGALQNSLAWGTLIFFIAVPLEGVEH